MGFRRIRLLRCVRRELDAMEVNVLGLLMPNAIPWVVMVKGA